jgi:ubiquinone/menaquinone biosynthesis C-methylase UbiE
VQETWNEYWRKIEPLSTEKLIERDSCYRLLGRLIDLPQDQNLRILEVGCGSGIRTLALVKKFQDYHLDATLVDFSAIALAFAKKNAEKNGVAANFVLTDAFKLPFPDESFDIVWNGGVNEHFDGEKRQSIFNEMVRVCKRGGQVVVIVPNALNPFYRLWKKVFEMQGRWEYGFEKPFTIFELKNRMKKAGLIPQKAGGTGVLSTIFHIVEIIPKKKSTNKAKGNLKQSETSGMLKKIFYKVDMISERVLWFAGGNIGIKGMK